MFLHFLYILYSYKAYGGILPPVGVHEELLLLRHSVRLLIVNIKVGIQFRCIKTRLVIYVKRNVIAPAP